MYFRKTIFTFFVGIILMNSVSCGPGQGDTTQNLSKENSIEIVVNTKHLNEKYDLIKTTRRVYLQNNLIKENSTFDTIPALGRTQVQDDDSKIKTVVKDYDIFVTVQ